MAKEDSGKKCPFCGHTHPSNTKYCPTTGKDLYTSCTNPDCRFYNKKGVPVSSAFCPECGSRLQDSAFDRKKTSDRTIAQHLCPYCGGSHPITMRFCTTTGKKLLVSCPNANCVNHGKESIRIGTQYCPSCGAKIKEKLPKGKGCARTIMTVAIVFFVIAFLLLFMSTCH